MKKIFFPGVFLALMLIFSCSKDEFTEEDATKAQKDVISYQDSIDQVRDSLNMIGGIIQYSVSVIPVDGSTGFVGGSYKSTDGVQMLSGAKVSVSQHGVVKTDSTDESGIVSFHDLRVGTVNVSVRADDYTNVNFIAEIKPEDDPNVTVYYGILRSAATMVPVFSLTEGTSTISGRLTYETDLTNTTPEIAAGATVIAMLDIDDSDFRENYFENLWDVTFSDYHAQIVQAAYTDLTVSAVTDAAGDYSLTVPSAADGLPFMMEVSDMVSDQQLLMNTVNDQPVNGVQTIRTIFTTDDDVTPSTVPSVAAAYVEFSAPTGSVADQPDANAQGQAVISESGIASINITNQGAGYTQAPIITITGDGEGAEAIAYISQGKVTSVEITNEGSGYTTATVVVTDKDGANATATPVVTYSVTSFTMTDNGSGYQSQPVVTVNSSTGTGASGEAIMSGYITEINVTDQGSGYVCPPEVVIEGSTGTDALATADMTNYNPIHSIELTSSFTTKYETTPTVLITPVSTGSGATAIAQLSTSGSINRIELSDAGLGYTEAPTVLITGGGGFGAVAYATLNGDGSINIWLQEEGEGYTSDPVVEISAPPAGGTQAVASVVREFEIENLILTNTGAGYNISYNDFAADDYDTEPNVNIDGVNLSDAQVIVKPNMKIEAVNINNAGTEYNAAPAISFIPKCGYGSGATAVTEILYFVERIDVVTVGADYGYDANVVVTVVTPPEGCLTQAEAYANLGDGVLAGLEVVNGGEGYLAPPHITINPTSYYDEEPVIEAIVAGGEITGFTVVNPGEGFNYYNSYSATISTNTEPANFQAEANPEAGRIAFVTISDVGEGYTSTPIVEFVRLDRFNNPVTSHNFTDAVATAILEDGRVVGVEITNPGTGYYYTPDVEIYIPSYNQTAEGTPVVNANGHITSVNITNAGMGYVTPPTITFFASVPGMGADATGVVVIANGMVDDVTMTNMGDGYLGKNQPGSAQGVTFTPTGEALETFIVYAGKAYIRDINLGTGKRTIED